MKSFLLLTSILCAFSFAQTNFANLGANDSGGTGFKTIQNNSNIVVSNVMANDGTEMYTGTQGSTFKIKANGVEDFTFEGMNFRAYELASVGASSSITFKDKDGLTIQTMTMNADKSLPTSSTSVPGFFDNGTSVPIANVAEIDFNVKTPVQEFTMNFNWVDITLSNYTLAVDLTAFSAKYKDNTVVLNWQTDMESNVAGFFIERSTDKLNWERLADCQTNSELSAQGMFIAQPEYTFVDESVISGESYYYRLGEISTTGATKIYAETFVKTPAVPQTTALTKIYPNPFNPQTTISYQLADQSRVQLEVYDVLGRKVRTLVDGMDKAGTYEVMWDGLNTNGEAVASGIYHIILQTREQKQVRQIALVR